MNTTCPSSDSLRQYALGDVNDALADQIETHLADCPVCEETIASFDSADDTLVRHLPLAAGNEGNVAADTPGWLDRLRSGPPVGQATLEPSVVADGANVPLDQFSAYELLGVLGHGGMGVVYRARHRQLNRNVALKVLSPRSTAAPEARRRFEREIQALGGLHHPGIVMATDAGRINEAAYLVMELVDGVDLARLVRQGGPFTIAEACEAGRQMAEALAAAHEVGTIHRDVKPPNVMIDRRGRVKLLDFGLAHLHALSTESLETSLGRLLGTLDYMAPEQAAGDGTPGASADLYGLGATLFFLLTGRAPRSSREGRSLVQQLRAIVDAEVPRVSTLRADVPPELDDFVARLLSRDPNERPPSAEAVAVQLKQWAGGNLAARVIESKTNHAPDETASDNSELVLQSLSELVGPNIARSSQSGLTQGENAAELEGKRNPVETAGLYGGGRRRWAWIAAAAGAFAATFYGIVIVLQAPNGTLRIESDVDDIAITVVDENNKEQDMTVDHRGDETSLAAGRYRISFKGNHDGITKDRDVVTLKRGELAVVKITRTEHSHVAAVPEKYVLGSTELDWQNFLRAHRGLANIDQSCSECHRQSPLPAVRTIDVPKTADSTPGDRTYNGKSESEWRRIYLAETYSAAKLEAANALLEFAVKLPPEKQIEEILNIGEEHVRASVSGTNYMSFAIGSLSATPSEARVLSRGAGRGGRGGRGGRLGGGGGGGGSSQFGLGGQVLRGRAGVANPDLTTAARNFQARIRQLTNDLPAEFVVGQLCQAAVGRSEPRAAFALALLRQYSRAFIDDSPAAAQVVMHELKEPPLVGFDRADTILLTQFEYLQHANDSDRQAFLASLKKWVDRLVQDRRASSRAAIEALMQNVRERDDWPIEMRQSFARLVYGIITDEPRLASIDDYFTLAESEVRQLQGDGEEIVPPYDKRYVAAARKKMQYFLDQWPTVANRSLESGIGPARRYGADIVRSLECVLSLYSDGDDWPVDKSVDLLTYSLNSRYARTYNPADPTLRDTPAELLAQVVQITGQIPESVRTATPDENLLRKLKDFEAFLAGEREKFAPYPLTYFAGLYDAVPLEVTKLALSDTKTAPIRGRNIVYTEPLTPRFILYLASSGDAPPLRETIAMDLRQSFVDPLLLLATLTNLAGESETQDERIATLVGGEFGLQSHLKNLLASPLKAREHARRMLTEMAAKAKSPALVAAIRAINGATEKAAAGDGELEAPQVAESPAEPQAVQEGGARRGRRGGADPRGAAALPATDLSASAAVKLAKEGKWDAAAKAFAAEVEEKPNEYVLQILAATVEHHLGHDEEYRKYCARLLERFGETSDARAAERIARLCSIAPGGVKEYAQVDRMMERALELDNNSDYWRMWDALSKAIVDYRAGRPAAAENWLNRCQTYLSGTVGSGHRAARDGILNATLALAMFDQGKIDDAKSALEEARTILKLDLPDFPEKAYAGITDDWVWFDALHCLFLIEKAEKKLGVAKERKPASAQPAAATIEKIGDK